MEDSKTKKPYVKPTSEIVNIENNLPILCASGNDFGNGGTWW